MENELFTETKISKAYIRLSLPLVFSMVVTLIYNLADTYFVAQTNDTDLVAGVSLGVPVFTFLMALGNIFGQGGSSLISRLLGQEDAKGARHASSFCFYGALMVGVVVGAVMLILRVPVLGLLGAEGGAYSHAMEYYTYLSLGAPFIVVSFIHSNLLRSEGLSKESMMGTIGGAVANIILDPVMISGMKMGASGAAIATIIGYLLSDLFFVVMVAKKSHLLSLHISEIKVPYSHMGQIFGIGIPAALSNVMQSVSIILVNQFLLPYGNSKIAAMGIVLKVNMIALLILTGLTFGGQPLFGYYYGASDKKRLGELFRFCVKFLGAISVILTAGIFLSAPLLLKCFMDNAQIIEDGTRMLRWQVITMIFVSFVLLMTIIFQSTGKVFGSFLLSVSRQGIVFLIVLMIAYRIAGYMGVLASQAIADVLTAILAGVLFYQQLYQDFRS